MKEKVTTQNVYLSDSISKKDDPTDNSPRLKRLCGKDRSVEFDIVELFWLF